MEHTEGLSPVISPGQTVWQRITLEAGVRLGRPPLYVQIATPERIPPEQRAPFEAGPRRILLISAAAQERLPAMVATIGETAMIVDTDAPTLWRKPGEHLLVVFPVAGPSYVLQTVVEAVAVQRLTLRYQDPRYDVRRQVPLATPVALRLVAPATVTAINRRQVHLMRAISPPMGPHEGPQIIADRLRAAPHAAPAVPHSGPDECPALTCGLKDISLGGAALTYAAPLPAEAWDHRVVHLQMALAGRPTAPPEAGELALMLDLFGSIRQVETTAVPWILHIQFLARLPEVCAPLLARLEDPLAPAWLGDERTLNIAS
jgi:hypothetical protein